mgnify:CR=1 FL=1
MTTYAHLSREELLGELESSKERIAELEDSQKNLQQTIKNLNRSLQEKTNKLQTSNNKLSTEIEEKRKIEKELRESKNLYFLLR